VSDLSEYYLNSRSDVVSLDLIEFSHPGFSQTYRIVRNAREGVTVDLSPSELAVPFEYFPARVENIGARDDLDSGVRIEIADLGEVIPGEIDNVQAANLGAIKPTVRFWAYRSDDLSAPMFGPIILDVPSINFTEQGAAFEARAPTLNSTKTGERYTLVRFPMLRGFL